MKEIFSEQDYIVLDKTVYMISWIGREPEILSLIDVEKDILIHKDLKELEKAKPWIPEIGEKVIGWNPVFSNKEKIKGKLLKYEIDPLEDNKSIIVTEKLTRKQKQAEFYLGHVSFILENGKGKERFASYVKPLVIKTEKMESK